ncbi:2-succinyl-5-enolpyruvyl-6-hydroxy-3-cyclohexene-1-carboxylate synthase [Motilibacter rhizosphaerae]|uniref:2-succinyl-5-enolpyruvyl-6-hydroxy-3-cyclohexene-1-carboxylate synthase n=1 Tax=Motilibacter rhizosphaerae TaxID=598652 RepID=A0A4Q7NAH3_9ACTN|nr:2-succinyl-5-enolpyruvyl-6-hydroxy-3-cyclohexene-1-carboxylic-acid synthase [Motilibacter rhizosphaerae]RZS79034.1 2-succinyl-5-enolpyruvyl-6-hydroxy-3-cyclohexene-1-carboxylate synthase [Motilibacter rhizosphaerae]
MTPATALAEVVVDELVRGGVQEAVLSPGSRSAPLAYALHRADAERRLRLHVRIDERSAGFLALGLARASGMPVPVVTTSGTAVANLHPAVVEASYAGVPLLALTADRPAELVGVGANQTIDQVGLFGSAVRGSFAVPAPDLAEPYAAWWRAVVCRALGAASGALSRDPGPVQLDLAFREPLVPSAGVLEGALAGRADGGPWTVPAGGPDPDPEMYVGAPRTLVLVGACSPTAAACAERLAADTGWPLVAEVASGVRGLPAGLLGSAALLEAAAPERVLVVGRPTLSRSVGALLRRPGVVVDVLSSRPVWPDPSSVAGSVHVGWLDAVGSADEEFAAAWASAAATHRDAVEGLLSWPSGEAVAAAVASAVPRGGLLVVGASNPVRDLDAVSWRLTPGAAVVANRGAAGIDGTVSTAVGAALAHQADGGGAAYALLGDLTFLHDANGLVLGPEEPRPDLCLVVLNDDGGGIFSLLEQGSAELAGPFERVFGTPHGVDLGGLCAAKGVPHALASSASELEAALAPAPGVRVVEVRVPRAERRARTASLRAGVEDALQARLS